MDQDARVRRREPATLPPHRLRIEPIEAASPVTSVVTGEEIILI